MAALLQLAVYVSSGDSSENRFAADQDEYGADTMTEIHIVGRITLNLWRVMKTEASFLVQPPCFQTRSSINLVFFTPGLRQQNEDNETCVGHCRTSMKRSKMFFQYFSSR